MVSGTSPCKTHEIIPIAMGNFSTARYDFSAEILGRRNFPFILGLDEIMRHFKSREFAGLFEGLTRYFWIADKRSLEEEIDVGVLVQLEAMVEAGTALTESLELKASHERIFKHLRLEIIGAYGKPRWSRLRDQIDRTLETLFFEISQRRFAAIPISKSEFLEGVLTESRTSFSPGKRQDERWLKIWGAFPSVREECEEAVYCYALERNIACVFHSMRIAEIGLRAFARGLKVKLPKSKKLEWAEWQVILREISKKIERVGQTTKPGPAKDALLDFYSGAFGQFMGFKDEFRNQVMHLSRAEQNQASVAE